MRTRRLRIGLVGAVVPLALLTGLALGGDAPGGDRHAEGIAELKLVRGQLERAEDHAREAGATYRLALGAAHKQRSEFIKVAFGGYSYLDGCNAGFLLRTIDEMETAIHEGFYQQGEERHKSLDDALKAARSVVNDVGECSPGDVAAPRRMVATLRKLIREHEGDKVNDADGQRGYVKKLDDVNDYNNDLIAGASDQVKGGCEVPAFHRSLGPVGASIVTAELYTPKYFLAVRKAYDPDAPGADLAEESAEKVSLGVRRKDLENSIDRVNNLISEWRKCSRPFCSDRIDNDGNSDSDRGDIGCRSLTDGGYAAEDWSENKAEMPTTVCPPAGVAATPESPAGSSMTNTNAGDEVTGIVLHNVSTGKVLLARDREHDNDLVEGGPVSVGDGVCGPGTQTFVFWKVEGTTVAWEFVFYKENKDVAPLRHRMVAVANTR